ncbi:hypothetical protein EW146_g1269 [Bondarzewia mesenterica]|uniref:Enoyl reductase (ER) domain-containing protein n=1 Tax=Bondarzewia mesenterica TaxID=1095465 RepID=A0A4S4M4F2_9AGAM|nr:hypothetical protein EW146_g1269 [Bondarzewia mesenterica]
MISTKKKGKGKKRKRDEPAPAEIKSDASSSSKCPQPETVFDPSSQIASAEIPTAKRPKMDKAAATAPPIKAKKHKEDQARFKDSRGSGPRRKTEEGFAIYKEDELGIKDEGGDTPLCPFDCDCSLLPRPLPEPAEFTDSAHRLPSVGLTPLSSALSSALRSQATRAILTGARRSLSTMKALVYNGPQKYALEDRPKPEVKEPTDAVIKLTKSTICGTDLHILKGDVATAAPGLILGHEGLGIVESVGSGVRAFTPGDRVIISCVTSCATCEYCRRGMPSHCTSGGWILGNTIDGTQADFRALLMISDILPTGYECGVLNGKVRPGSTVAVVGSGPIGLSAMLSAGLYSPSKVIAIDLDPNRLEVSKRFGATHTVQSGPDAVKQVMEITGGRGVDTAIEAVGMPKTFELCQELIAPGGTIANIGVHGTKVDLHMENLWDRNISITTRLVDTITAPTLIQLLVSGRLDAQALTTHTFKFADMAKAYQAFSAAAENKALKVVVEHQ